MSDTFSSADLEARILDMEDSKAKCLAKVEKLTTDIEALRRTLAILTGSPLTMAGSAGNGAKKGQLIQRIREAVLAIHGDFTSDDVAAWIKERYSDFDFDPTSISGGLKKLLDANTIVQKVAPAGRRPGVYAVAPDENPVVFQ